MENKNISTSFFTYVLSPILRGKDIEHYSYQWAGLWVIDTHNGYKDSEGNEIPPIDIKQYPAIKSHLDEIQKKS